LNQINCVSLKIYIGSSELIVLGIKRTCKFNKKTGGSGRVLGSGPNCANMDDGRLLGQSIK
jgi:hypothetical protein